MMTIHSHKIMAALAVATTGFPSSLSAFVPADMSNPDIPWQDLFDTLDAEATLLPASNQDYIDQCFPEFRDNAQEDRTNFRLRNQTSGVCVAHWSCGFENCFPSGNDWDNWGALMEVVEDLYPDLAAFETAVLSASGPYPFDLEEWTDPSISTFNIPSSVLFPAVAGDVVAAVKFAGDNGLQLSVKASGHSYAGASTKKDTLLVNTFLYKQYSPNGIVECGTSDASSPKADEVVDPDLANQACLLALARNKEAFVRVGGGEAWADVYISVRQFNEAQERFKYHVVGGAAGSVTPMGWTFQGGLGGTTGGRLFGFGVDQVLQIEAVLPNGEHVRFGPTSWEDEAGFDYPRTTAVSGVCNANPEDEEEKWKWEPCPMEINFDDLWFAFRGGGGGTWGIVTSVYLQLSNFLPLEFFEFFGARSCLHQLSGSDMINPALGRYALDYLLDPASLGVSVDDSNACGFAAGVESPPLPVCYGEGTGKKYLSTLKSYLQNRTEGLLATGVTENDIVAAGNCFDATLLANVSDWFEVISYNGDATDSPPPGTFDQPFEVPMIRYNILVPLSTYQANKEKFAELTGIPGVSLYGAFGKNLAFSQDQTTSLSTAHREAAFMFLVPEHLAQEYLDLYGIASDATEIPGFIGGNHFSATSYGPLKSNSSKICTYNSFEEAEEKCHPTQVAVWGSETLARLERIKEEIDPNYMFDCNKCVGNNRIKSVPSVPEEPKEEPTDVSEPDAEPTQASEPQEEPKEDAVEDIKEDPGSADVDGSGGVGNWHSAMDYYLFIVSVVTSFFIV